MKYIEKLHKCSHCGKTEVLHIYVSTNANIEEIHATPITLGERNK